MSNLLYPQMLCTQMLKERERNRREEDHNPTAAYNHSISASFSATTYPPNLYTTHFHTTSITLLHTPAPFTPTALLPCPLCPLFEIHPITLWPPHLCTNHPTTPANLSQIPHNSPGNKPHFPYSAITHYTPFIAKYSTYLLIPQQPSFTSPQPEQ